MGTGQSLKPVALAVIDHLQGDSAGTGPKEDGWAVNSSIPREIPYYSGSIKNAIHTKSKCIHLREHEMSLVKSGCPAEFYLP